MTDGAGGCADPRTRGVNRAHRPTDRPAARRLPGGSVRCRCRSGNGGDAFAATQHRPKPDHRVGPVRRRLHGQPARLRLLGDLQGASACSLAGRTCAPATATTRRACTTPRSARACWPRCRPTSTTGAVRSSTTRPTWPQRIYLVRRHSDFTVGPNPMKRRGHQYAEQRRSRRPTSSTSSVPAPRHVFPTDFDATGNNACGTARRPIISNCGYDGARAVFTKFYGRSIARNNAPAAVNYIEFNQTAFTTNPGHGADRLGVRPGRLRCRRRCRFHVALHGCQQGYATIGDKFLRTPATRAGPTPTASSCCSRRRGWTAAAATRRPAAR